MTTPKPRATSRRKRYWALKHVGTNYIRPELWITYSEADRYRRNTLVMMYDPVRVELREVRTGKGKSK